MKRWISAFRNSLSGLRHGFRHETALREEMIALLLSVPAALLLTQQPWKLMALWGSLLLLLIVELLNTGIEQVANRVTRDHSEEIKFAKDCGSAAVLGTTLLAAGVWLIAVIEKIA